MKQLPFARLLSASWLLSLLLVLPNTASARELIRMNGTGAAISIVQKLAIAFETSHPEIGVEIHLPVAGSGGSIRGMLGGSLDIAVSARSLKPRERAHGLMETVFARTPFVIAVARSNRSATDLSQAELINVYSGKTRNWPNGNRLRLILRPLKDSDTVLLKSLSPAMEQAVLLAHSRKGMPVAMTDQDSADMIANIDGAVGTSLLSLMIAEQRPLRPLAIDGVIPSVQTMQDGSYPHHKSFHLITRTNPSGSVIKFLQFIQTPEARRIITDNGTQAL